MTANEEISKEQCLSRYRVLRCYNALEFTNTLFVDYATILSHTKENLSLSTVNPRLSPLGAYLFFMLLGWRLI